MLEATKNEDYGIKDFLLRCDGEGWRYLNLPGGGSLRPASHETVEQNMHYLYQDGKTVFKFAVRGMVDLSQKLMEKNNLSIADIDIFIPHQANYRIIDSVAEKLGIDKKKVVVSIEKYGNTSAATIPIAMSKAYEAGRIKKGDTVMLSAFGAGFTWGSVLLSWGDSY